MTAAHQPTLTGDQPAPRPEPVPRSTPLPNPRWRCGRCRRWAARVVTAYWDPALVLCGPCCSALAAHFDTTNTWPTQPSNNTP
jgi:hypothetical protein